MRSAKKSAYPPVNPRPTAANEDWTRSEPAECLAKLDDPQPGASRVKALTPACQSQLCWLSRKTYRTVCVCARVFFKAFVDHQIYIYIYSFAVFPSNSGQVSNARRVSDGTRAGRPAHERPTCGQLSPQPNNLDDFGVPNSLSKPQVQLKIFQVGTFHRL